MLSRGHADVEGMAPFLADVSQSQTLRIYKVGCMARRTRQTVDAPSSRWPEMDPDSTSVLAADLVNRVVGYRYDVEVALRSLLDVGRRPEPPADLKSLTFRSIELLRPEQIVSHMVGEPGIGALVHMETIRCQSKPVQAATIRSDLLKGTR